MHIPNWNATNPLRLCLVQKMKWNGMKLLFSLSFHSHVCPQRFAFRLVRGMIDEARHVRLDHLGNWGWCFPEMMAVLRSDLTRFSCRPSPSRALAVCLHPSCWPSPAWHFYLYHCSSFSSSRWLCHAPAIDTLCFTPEIVSSHAAWRQSWILYPRVIPSVT